MTLIDVFADLPDPRLDRQKRHKLLDIVIISICAVLSGIDNFVDMELYARCKESFFKRFLELPNGIPSHDTFNRAWGLVCPKAFESRFQLWIEDSRNVFGLAPGTIALDPRNGS